MVSRWCRLACGLDSAITGRPGHPWCTDRSNLPYSSDCHWGSPCRKRCAYIQTTQACMGSCPPRGPGLGLSAGCAC